MLFEDTLWSTVQHQGVGTVQQGIWWEKGGWRTRRSSSSMPRYQERRKTEIKSTQCLLLTISHAYSYITLTLVKLLNNVATLLSPWRTVTLVSEGWSTLHHHWSSKDSGCNSRSHRHTVSRVTPVELSPVPSPSVFHIEACSLQCSRKLLRTTASNVQSQSVSCAAFTS